tara:strand:- start:2251 stop:2469 length:219 start_codon:yes stop_codon:yes gene_type:complete
MALQKVYRDTNKTITLWSLGHDGNMSLEFTGEQLLAAGITSLNIFDLQLVFRCDVTIKEETLHTVRYTEKED